ncbi:CAP domain-containing protein [Kitasatospora sp. NPDC001547]|uniref:CAP domain-containing protein n=1 Tax=Kitasatospora sp. NPDC001547 TaxID=3364015 RepID=UPI003686A170
MPTPVRNGQVWTLRSANGTVADLGPGRPDRGTPIRSGEPNGTSAQGWVSWAIDGNWVLETQLTRGRYAPGQAMVMHYDHGAGRTSLSGLDGQPAQRWCLEVVGGGWLRIRTMRADARDLFLTASVPGSPLTLARLNHADPAQHWQFVPADGTGGGRRRPEVRPRPVAGDVHLEMLTAVNAERTRIGARPVRLDERLTAAAQRHADDVATHGLTQHDGSDGSTPWRRVRAAGFAFRFAAENVAPADNVPEAMGM